MAWRCCCVLTTTACRLGRKMPNCAPSVQKRRKPTKKPHHCARYDSTGHLAPTAATSQGSLLQKLRASMSLIADLKHAVATSDRTLVVTKQRVRATTLPGLPPPSTRSRCMCWQADGYRRECKRLNEQVAMLRAAQSGLDVVLHVRSCCLAQLPARHTL